MKNLILLTLTLTLAACSSSRYKVVESLNDKDTPSWASLGKTTWKKDGKVYAVGVAEGVEPDRVTGLLRISDNNAKGEITRLIATEVGVDFKNIEAGLRGEGSFSFIGSEKSMVSIQELGPEDRHFDKLQLKDNENAPIKIYSYSLFAIPEQTFNYFVQEARQKMKNADTTASAAPQE